MAVAIQANLVQLKTAAARRQGIPVEQHPLRIGSPGAVKQFRETLIDHRALSTFSPAEILFRFQEVWGQFCLMRWVFHRNHAAEFEGFERLPANSELRCHAEMEAKEAEIHAHLWRLRFEWRSRAEPGFASNPGYSALRAAAERIPVKQFARQVPSCSDDELLAGSCEAVGMLRTVRWIKDQSKQWGESSLANLDNPPF